ncbi:MAG: restriction endonuclease subunit S [Lachnospiraceae bacterium]|nr:restriction endonuclease subunit S [Lachnospiraceae bacterium]
MLERLEVSIIHLNNLERTKRIDAEFYSTENLHASETMARKQIKSIQDVCLVSDGNHMSISYDFQETGIPYYRGQDTCHTFIEDASPVCISEKSYRLSVMLRSHIHKGDVLLSIVGTVGNSSLVYEDNEATCSCKLAILRPQDKDIYSEYLAVFCKTKYGQNQIQKFRRGTVQTGLLLEDMDQISIPVLNTEFQEKIVDITENMYSLNSQAQQLYLTAKNLLLTDLGLIDYTPSKEQISVRSFKDIVNMGRLDAEYYQPKYDDLFVLLDKLPTKLLGEIVDIKKSIEPGSTYYGDYGVPFIRVSDVSTTEISAPSIRIPYNIVPSIEELYPKKDTILFSKDGSVGIAYKMEEDIEAVTSGALLHFHIKNNEEILPDYLTLVLNSDIVQLQAERDASGAIIQHWKPNDIANVVIPIFPYKVQKEISDNMQQAFALRRRAQKLQKIAIMAVEIAIEKDEITAIAYINDNRI